MIRNLTFQARYWCLFGLFLLPSYGALITYTNRSAFGGIVPGLSTETFATGLVNPDNVIICSGPLSGTTGNTCFPTGGLLPGVVYSSTSGSMALIGTGYTGIDNSSNLLGANLFADTLDLTFTQVSAVGFNVFAGPNPGNVFISVYNAANIFLSTFTVSVPSGGAFFGVVSDLGLIGRINVNSQAVPAAELIGNVSFGVPIVAPEPCSLPLLGAGFVGIVLWCRKKQSLRH